MTGSSSNSAGERGTGWPLPGHGCLDDEIDMRVCRRPSEFAQGLLSGGDQHAKVGFESGGSGERFLVSPTLEAFLRLAIRLIQGAEFRKGDSILKFRI